VRPRSPVAQSCFSASSGFTRRARRAGK
jgi:hypothetical protein